jgi:predicted DNA-binding transcriptional regulator YafY
MSVRQSLKRYSKIISLLRRRPMSYQELQDEMALDPDAVEDKLLTSQRTLQRDIIDIASIYEIAIDSDKRTNKYYIKEDVEETYSRRLRENFEIVDAIKMTRGFGDTLIFEERRPLGTEHMSGFIHAIQNNLAVEFIYVKFWDNTKSERKLRPIALKEARNRWYLIAMDEKDNKIKNFSLDRIQKLVITPEKFKPISYNAHKEYKDCFGIINGTNEEAVEVILSFLPDQGRYIKSLPLHHSQQLVLENEEEIRFSYFIRPTYDFKMELLSYGDQVMVLEPSYLKEQIREQLQKALINY